MSHLQKGFIAKAKAKMHKGPQHMSNGMIKREATKVDVVGPIGSKKNPKKRTHGCAFAPYWINFTASPSYLQFTLKK